MNVAATIDRAELPTPSSVPELQLASGSPLPKEVLEGQTPVILRGYVADWPVIAAAADGIDQLIDYLRQFDKGAVAPVTVGSPSLRGRLFYNDTFDGFNADRGNSKMSAFLDRLAHHSREADPPLIYLASATVDQVLPGFRAENDVAFNDRDPLASIWIGTRTRIAAHNDLPRNLACIAAGHRRFTLFPPDQLGNLYIGPVELTPAGRPISLVDFAKPDLETYPRFVQAMATAQVAEVGPGDALFIPSMWWHHVEALDAVNVLLNYWWRDVPPFLGTPQDVLNHAMLTIRDLPQAEKEIWRGIFDHYVFENDEDTIRHIPEKARGILAPITEPVARRVRAFLLNRLNR